jgi:predicted Ser/Thr protein kinase
VLAGRYELEELVGGGGMSSVFRARDAQLGRRVAIKVLHDRYAAEVEYVQRFRREAEAAARLSHPNIVTVIDRGEDQGRQYIVFEHVEGENLKDLVLRAGRVPVRYALEVAVAVADGLAFAHEHGLVHRDVKPQNVLLSREDEIKVTDFGIARSLDRDRGLTQTGTVVGTGEYLAPEQARGEPVSPATDVYALGVVLWELLAGEVPFAGESFVAVALRHVREPVPSLRERRPDVPPRLAAAVERALAKEPARRFPSMAAFAAELRACQAELESEAPPAPDAASTLVVPPPSRDSRLRPGRPRPRRRPLLYAAGVLAAAAGTAALVLAGGGGHERSVGGGPGRAAAAAVHLRGVGDYDPQGDGGEPAYTAPRATDGAPATYWTTEIYATRAFGNLKRGLGLVLDAGSSVRLARLTVQTPTPGFTARVEVGERRQGPFTADSAARVVGRRTTFVLEGRRGRYYVVWLTELPPQRYARISEVTSR